MFRYQIIDKHVQQLLVWELWHLMIDILDMHVLINMTFSSKALLCDNQQLVLRAFLNVHDHLCHGSTPGLSLLLNIWDANEVMEVVYTNLVFP